jgi:hypothetical protein
MTVNRSRGAWIWVAVAAITLASIARAESGIENARAYAAPVIKFFAASQLAEPGASTAAHRVSSSSRIVASGMVLELLPVFFVGLVAPLSLLSVRPAHCLGRALAAPDLPGLFERPPPILLA